MSGDAAVQQIVAGFMDAWNRHDAPAFAALFAPDADLTNVYGSTTAEWVTANPELYATNGLVSDYVEKEFGLNPNTVDTAGSQMLDTWNLTFQLSSSSCPADFECWYENGSNPFSYSPTPGGSPPPSDKPVATNSTSVAHWTRGGLQDDAPYDANVLWTGGALGVLQSLIASEGVGWLRGVVMKYNGVWTLTVWGKLSWGANPLVQSTTGDGLPDGAQPNPVVREALQVTITSWTATLKSGNDEAAPFLEVSGCNAGAGPVCYDGYGPAKKGSSVSYSGAYVISAPIVSSNQFASLNITIVDNASTTGKNLYYPLQFGPISVDLLGSTGTHALSASQSNASLKVTYQVLRVGEAANTLLWAPANNTTLSNLPWGLKRYTAEPDFDLIVLNLTSAVTLTGIAGAEGGWTYSVHMDAGLNNLLVPRGAFLASPLGQALINNTNESVPIPSGAGVTFHATDWSSRTETSGTNAPGNKNYIWVYSTLSQSQNGSTSGTYGGVPSNPAVESGYESLQTQAVFWMNVTGSGYGGLTSANAELKDLFGGLILNASGNLTGNVQSVTTELGTLGLPGNVRAAMANVTLANDGAYAAPEYQQPPPSPSFWQSVGDAVWNTLSGIAAATGLTTLVSVVWNAVQAAAAYIGEAATWLSSHLGIGKLLNQAWSTLKSIASAMEWAFSQLLTFLISLAKAALGVVLSPFVKGAKAFDSALGVAANATLNDQTSLGYVTTADGLAWAHAFDPLAAVGVALATLVVIVLAILTPIDVVGDLALTVVLSLIPTLAENFIPGLPSLSQLSSQAVVHLEDSFPNSVSTTTWEAIAGSIAIGASSSDFFFVTIGTALKSAQLPAAAFLDLAAAITIDLIVLTISIVQYFTHLALVASTALFFALVGVYAAFQTSKGYAAKALGNFVYVSLGLAGVGLAAASADFILSE